MKHEIEVIIRRADGAIIRTLGLIERRGFAVTAVSTLDSACDDEMTMQLAVESPERSVDVLVRQIEKLIDVCQVTLAGSAEQRLTLREQVAC